MIAWPRVVPLNHDLVDLASDNDDLVEWGRSYLFTSEGRLHALLMRLAYLELETDDFLEELRAALEQKLFYLNAPNVLFRHTPQQSSLVSQGPLAHHLVIQNQPEAIALLLDYGLDLSLTNNARQTALDLAHSLGDREELADLLTQAMTGDSD